MPLPRRARLSQNNNSMTDFSKSSESHRGEFPVALLLTVLGLVTVGAVMLFSTSAIHASEFRGDSSYFLKRHLAYLVIGTCAAIFAAWVNPNLWRRHSNWLLIGAVILLALCLIPGLGLKINGARRWLGTSAIRFQPSDLAKFALLVFLATWFDRHHRRVKTFRDGFAVPIGVTALVCGLIFVEPDFGTTALTGLVAITLMFVAGTRWIFLIPTILLGAGGFALAIAHDPTRMKRILAFLDPEGTAQGAGYQTWQALLAFGSGGLTGRGLGNSAAKFFYLPEARTDFIFPIIGEELGLVGCLAVILAFATLIILGIRIALRANGLYSSLLALGIVSLIGFQAAINIGVVTGALPNKGLPLPFISFGGSNLVMNLLGIGVLVNIARHTAPDPVEEEKPYPDPIAENARLVT